MNPTAMAKACVRLLAHAHRPSNCRRFATDAASAGAQPARRLSFARATAAAAAAAGAGAVCYHWLVADVRTTAAYHALVRRVAMPLLRCLDPETAHALAVQAAAHGFVPMDGMPPDPILATELWGLRLSSPVGLAAGFDKQAEAICGLLLAGFGFVEIGSVTPLPQPGNPRPRMFRLPDDRAVINRFGFNSDGAVAVAERLASFRRGTSPDMPCLGLVGVNVGKNKTGEAEADYAAGITLLAPFADYLVVNVSSPNTPGLRQLQAPAELARLLTVVKTARDAVFAAGGTADAALVSAGPAALSLSPAASQAYRRLRDHGRTNRTLSPLSLPPRPPPLLVKIAPDLNDEEIRDIVAAALVAGIDGLVVGNTTVARPTSLRSAPALAAEAGGLSGAPLAARATDVVRTVYAHTRGRVPIVGVGGVASADDAYAKIRAGADVVQLYSALVYEGPGLVLDIKRGLAERLRADGFRSVREAVGADARDVGADARDAATVAPPAVVA